MTCAVLVPQGKIALGKMAQALVHGARLLQVDGNFDDCLALASKLAIDYPVALVNSVNIDRLHGQKTAAFEIVEALGDAPDIHCLPVGNAGNITAYWMGYVEDHEAGNATKRPRMFGFQAAGRRRSCRRGGPASRRPSRPRSGSATRPRWTKALDARDASGGVIDAVTDREILAAYRLLARQVGVFVELASAASVAGLLAAAARRAGAARVHRGLHGHRARPQGPGVGHLDRAGTDHHPDRRAGRGPPAGPRDGAPATGRRVTYAVRGAHSFGPYPVSRLPVPVPR